MFSGGDGRDFWMPEIETQLLHCKLVIHDYIKTLLPLSLPSFLPILMLYTTLSYRACKSLCN